MSELAALAGDEEKARNYAVRTVLASAMSVGGG